MPARRRSAASAAASRANARPVHRCAIYTRKSSEEGLEQEFNSPRCPARSLRGLHSEPEARRLGRAARRCMTMAGISGGTLERPALQRLLADIECRPGRHRRGLQGRPADPLAGRLRQDRGRLRRQGRRVRLGHPAVQHHHLHGPADAERAAVLCPVRARGHRRAHPRQDRRLQAEGHVDGRLPAARLRRRTTASSSSTRPKPRRSATSSSATPT